MTHDEAGSASGTRVAGFLTPEHFLPDLRAVNRLEALRELVDAVAAVRSIREPGGILRVLRDRETLGTTAIGKGVAIPHGRSLVVARPLLAFARSQHGVAWDAPDGEDVHLIFLLLAPDAPSSRTPYLEQLAQLARVVALARNRNRLRLAHDLDTVRAVLMS
jgi:PTS system nitrogen regulatory IIA component